MTSNDMPDEIWAKKYGQANGGTYWNKPIQGRTKYVRADLCAAPTDNAEALEALKALNELGSTGLFELGKHIYTIRTALLRGAGEK